MFKLIELPYKSLAPVISDETLSFHHGKHLQTYVDNLNKLIAGTEFEKMSLVDIVKNSSGAIFNNAGQILNHEMYFSQFKTPDQVGGDGSSLPDSSAPSFHGLSDPSFHGLSVESPLGKQIEKQWGTLAAFQADFEAKGVSLFGSGWVWLSADKDGTLVITQEPNAGNPVTKGLKPLLTFDVWEHAYYLDYQNRRAAHLKALWEIVDWKMIEKRYEQ